MICTRVCSWISSSEALFSATRLNSFLLKSLINCNRLVEDRDEEERQREEAERALAGPVQVDVVRAARLRRLAAGGAIS